MRHHCHLPALFLSMKIMFSLLFYLTIESIYYLKAIISLPDHRPLVSLSESQNVDPQTEREFGELFWRREEFSFECYRVE